MRKLCLALVAVIGVLAAAGNGPVDPNDPMSPDDPMMFEQDQPAQSRGK